MNIFTKNFKPSYVLNNFAQISKQYLINNDIKVIICDLNNTLITKHNLFLDKETLEFLKLIKKLNISLYIASNNTKNNVNHLMQNIPKDLYESFIWNAKKPLIKKVQKSFCNLKQYKANQILVIGDQFLTDIWLANKMKYHSLLLIPTSKQKNKSLKNAILKIINKFIYKRIEHEAVLIHINNYDNDNSNLLKNVIYTKTNNTY